MGCCVVHLDLVLGQVDLHRCELKIIRSALHVTIYSFRILDMGLKRAEMPFKSDEKSGKVGRTFPDFDF